MKLMTKVLVVLSPHVFLESFELVEQIEVSPGRIIFGVAEVLGGLYELVLVSHYLLEDQEAEEVVFGCDAGELYTCYHASISEINNFSIT